MPRPLAEAQRDFVASVLGARVLPAFADSVTGGGRLGPAAAVGVYRRAYPARMSEALGETFEACWRVLGDAAFLAACADYARAIPSVSADLSDYGRGFPDFLLARHGADAPFVADLGRLEWEFKELFHARAHAGLEPGALAATAGPRSGLVFGEAFKVLSFGHRVAAIRRRDRADETPLSPADWTGREDLALYKAGTSEVFLRALTPPQAAALRSLAGGAALEDALAGAEGLDESGAAELFAFLAEARAVTEFR